MSNVFEKIKAFFIKYKKPITDVLILIGFIVALITLFVLIVNVNIVANTNDNIYIPNEAIKLPCDFDCILILGAGIRKDGTPTPMLNDRLITAYEAYETLQVPIFLSGDSEYSHYTETVTMERTLIEMGVPAELIISDGYGLSTYESIWRAKNVYGYDKILIISQKYHLHRAIYISNELGVTAYGFDAALQGYAKQPIYNMREYLARIKDMIYSEIRPAPTYSQKWEGFDE